MKKTLYIWLGAICFCIISFFMQRAYFSHRESEKDTSQEFFNNNMADLGNNCMAYLVPNDEVMSDIFMPDENFTGDQYIAVYALDFNNSVSSDGDIYYLPDVYGNIAEMRMEESSELYIRYNTSESGDVEEVRIPLSFPARMTEGFFDIDAHATYSHYKKRILASQEGLLSGETIFPQTVWAEDFWIGEEQYEVVFERVSPIYEFFAENIDGIMADYRLTVKDGNGDVVWEQMMINYPVTYEETHWFEDFSGDGYLDIAFCTDLYMYKVETWSTLHILLWDSKTGSYEESELPKGNFHLWNRGLASMIITIGDSKEMYSLLDGEWKKVRRLEELYVENEYYDGTDHPVLQGYRELIYSEDGEILKENMLEIEEVLYDDTSVWNSDNAENILLYPVGQMWKSGDMDVGGISVYKYQCQQIYEREDRHGTVPENASVSREIGQSGSQEARTFLDPYHDFLVQENVKRAALIYLDGDTIPELLILKNGEYGLYFLDGSEVKAIAMPNAEVKANAYGQQHNFEVAEYQTFYWFEYAPYKGLIRVHSSADEERDDYYLKYAHGSFSIELETRTNDHAWHTYDAVQEISNEDFLSQISVLGYEKLIPCGYFYDNIETAYENIGATSDTKQVLEDFVSGKINALDHVEGKSDIPENSFVMISYEDYLEQMTAGDKAWINAISVEYIDFDNDGADELFIRGYAGSCIYFDVIGDTVYKVLMTSSTTDMSHVAEFQGKRVIERTDLGHVGRKYYHIMEFDACCCLIDWFALSASYEGTSYTEEDEFRYRGEKISMEEYEQIVNSIQ